MIFILGEKEIRIIHQMFANIYLLLFGVDQIRQQEAPAAYIRERKKNNLQSIQHHGQSLAHTNRGLGSHMSFWIRYIFHINA